MNTVQSLNETGIELAVGPQASGSNVVTDTSKAQGLTLTYNVQEVSVHIAKEKKDKVILSNVAGTWKAGTFNAILGPSGSGKTTLLNTIAGRTTNEHVNGAVYINDEPVTRKKLKHQSAFVLQEDHLPGVLTVQEVMEFAADFRFDRHTPKADKLARIDVVLKEMGLAHVRHTRVGNFFQRGLSGGQKRRLSVAVELVVSPRLLFLDEPTSGLDSSSALSVMEAIKGVSQRLGMTVVASIHQPSSQLLHLFDSTTFLAGGRLVYAGRPSGIPDHFTAMGIAYPANTNPADFVLAMTNSDFDSKDEAMLETILRGGHSSVPAHVRARVERLDKHPSQQLITPGAAPDAGTVVSYKNPAWFEVWTLLRRFGIIFRRDITAFGVRLGMALLLGITLGVLYLNLGHSYSDGVVNLTGAYFFGVTVVGFCSVVALGSAYEERGIFLHEHKGGNYRVVSYVISAQLIRIPFLVGVASAMAVPLFYMIGYDRDDAGRMFFYVLIHVLEGLASEPLTLSMAFLLDSPTAALAMAINAQASLMMFSGQFIRLPQMPRFFQGMSLFSFGKWALEALLLNALPGQSFTCVGAESRDVCAITGEDVLEESFGSTHALFSPTKWVAVGALFALYVANVGGFYQAVRRKSKK